MLDSLVHAPRFLLAAAVMAVVALTATAAPARADYFAMITIDNPTNSTVYYQFKWGSGDWKNYSVAPYTYRNHAYPLNANGRAPSPYIRFDDGAGSLEEYHLGFYDSDSWGYYQGKQYLFNWYGGALQGLRIKSSPDFG